VPCALPRMQPGTSSLAASFIGAIASCASMYTTEVVKKRRYASPLERLQCQTMSPALNLSQDPWGLRASHVTYL
jgi:hypothetical protein